MAKKNWVFNLDAHQHSLNFEQGFSGKKKILIDNNLAYQSQGIMDTAREFSFEVEGHSVVLLIKPDLVDSYDLMVDDQSLETGRIGPDRIKVEETAEGTMLTYRGGRGVFAILLIFGLLFTGISVVGFYNSLSSGALTLADMLYLPILFPLIGLGLIYWSLVKMLNKTNLTVSVVRVVVKQVGNRELSATEIEQLYCESYERKPRSGGEGITVTMSFILFRICARLTNGQKVVLLSDLDQCYEALFVNRQLEHKLGKLVQPELQHA